jgi:hypothetical protein
MLWKPGVEKFNQGDTPMMRLSVTVRILLVFACIIASTQGAFAQKYELYPYAGGYWPAKIDEFKVENQAIWGGRGGWFVTDKFEVEGNFGYLNHFKFDGANLRSFLDVGDITVITITNNTVTTPASIASGVVISPLAVPTPTPPKTTTTTTVVVTHLDPGNVLIDELDPKNRGYIWEANGSYNFFSSKVGKFAPYLTAGLGGITVTRSDDFDTTVTIDQPNLTPIERTEIMRIVNERVAEARAIFPAPIHTGSYFSFNYGGGLKGYRLWGPVGLRVDFLGRTLPNFGGRALNAFQLTGGPTFSFGER